MACAEGTWVAGNLLKLGGERGVVARLVRRRLAAVGLVIGMLLIAPPLHADIAPANAVATPAERVTEAPAPSRLPPAHRQFGPAAAAGEPPRRSFPRVLFQLKGRLGDTGELRFRVQAKRKQVFFFEYRF